MKSLTIELDDELLAEIDKNVTGIITRGDVIRRLLLNSLQAHEVPKPLPPSPNPAPEGSMLSFLQSPEYAVKWNSIDKYLALLGWLYKNKNKDFARVENYNRGNRRYFARNEEDILKSGENITAKPIPNTPFWALATLDNKTKRLLMRDILTLYQFSQAEISAVLATIPDTGRHRGGGISVLLTE